MRSTFLLFLVVVGHLTLNAQKTTTIFEQSDARETPTYSQIIEWWTALDKKYPQLQMRPMGASDAGFPLHLVLLSNDRDFDIASNRRKNKRVVLVNNGIHPGEPDGIDATMLLVRDILEKKKTLPDNLLLAIIPVYNIGGCLNRSANFRVDQNGPEAFGFRGNSQNLDLNRDFIKADSKEARSFAQIFHMLDPDVLVDNHVSNGADYQHVMTLLTSQHSKLGGAMGQYLNDTFEPALYSAMKTKGYDLIPYVSFSGETPEQGITAFFDSPRYSSGFATLFHTFAFMPETHMLKPYRQRVESTYALMECFIAFVSAESNKIRDLRQTAKKEVQQQVQFPLNWAIDRSQASSVTYKGYEAGRKPSGVSGLPRLYYDRSKPFEREIPFYNFYKPTVAVESPKAYVIPQGWWKVIELLRLNGVKMSIINKDTSIEVESYRIVDYKSTPRQYEMHHLNSDVKIDVSKLSQHFRKGDVIVHTAQPARRFIVEVLEPQGNDSYFAWNYFDAILGQKEGFSAYAFEDIAAEYLQQDPTTKKLLEQRRQTDTAFAKSAAAQLDFVFKHSPYYEPNHMRYPVYRIVD